MTESPFFSIVSVTRNDVWAMVKTAQSVFSQSCRDLEYIVVDGASTDQTASLVSFWEDQGLVSQSVSERDTCVYDAMNKGLAMARGDYVCFMNASDVFADASVLDVVKDLLQSRGLDGLLGWGELNGQIWGSWAETEAFKMASLGFCHQALFVRRELLLQNRFDDRPFKTDSDTLQLGRLFGAGARISILPEVLAIRGGAPGLSANLELTQASIRDTLTGEYPGLTEAEADTILAFRRRGEEVEAILATMARAGDTPLARHLAYTVLDTLFQRASRNLPQAVVTQLTDAAFAALRVAEDPHSQTDIRRLTHAQARRDQMLVDRKTEARDLDRAIAKFEGEEENRINKLKAAGTLGGARETCGMVVSLTSFPARLKTVSFAIRSLLEQTRPPEEIHLWLGRDEVPNQNWLPGRLRALMDLGVQVHFADRTFYQYDKFLHNAALNADRPFVIVDDDVIYPPTSMEHLWEAHLAHPDKVVANRCHWMALEPDGTPAPYKQWTREVRMPAPNLRLVPTGAGGVLYPPGFMADPRVTDIDLILSHAPYADDIWLKTCALARDIPTVATALSHKADWYHRYTPTMMAGTLMATNVDRGLNDTQIARCNDWLSKVRPGWRQALLQAEERP